jgi:hypothetical protein
LTLEMGQAHQSATKMAGKNNEGRAFGMLEPREGELSRTVLRGKGADRPPT